MRRSTGANSAAVAPATEALLFAATVLLAALAGCCEPYPKTILTQDELVARFNANAARVPRLWARAKIYVHLVDDKGRAWDWGDTVGASTNGLVCLRKADSPLGPHDFALQGLQAGEHVFRLGVSTVDKAYYYWARMGDQNGTYGSTALAGAPGRQGLPVNPLDLMSVLGLVELPADFTRTPTVLLRMDETPCRRAYVLTCIDRQPLTDRLVARREIDFDWSDQRPPRPTRIQFLDEYGRPVMVASLREYRAIRLADVEAPATGPAASKTAPPVMPTDIEITWPATGSRIHVVLSEMTTEDRVDPDLFLFWERLPRGVRENLTCADPETPAPGAGR